jgi:hypothetical protein
MGGRPLDKRMASRIQARTGVSYNKCLDLVRNAFASGAVVFRGFAAFDEYVDEVIAHWHLTELEAPPDDDASPR